MKQIVVLLLLAYLLTHTAQANFCSVICGTSCQGNLNTQCGTGLTNCQTDGAWSNIGNTCVPKSNWVYFNSTSDYMSGTLTNSATTSESCGNMNFYGLFTPSPTISPTTSITISANGILRPHYQVRIYVGIIAVDVDCRNSCGNDKWYWNGWTAYFLMQFTDPLNTETINPTVYKARTNTREYLCYEGKFR